MTWLDSLARFFFGDRCHQWQLGPFATDWRCVQPRKHEGDHIYEPDLWVGGRLHDEWVGRGGLRKHNEDSHG